MRIGMILDKTFPPDPRVENEAVALVNAGHEVFLFCLNYAKAQSIEVINGIQVRRYRSNRFEYKLSALAYTFPLYSSMMRRKIDHFLNENRIEALHIHDIRIAEAALKANKAYKLPVVLDLHDNLPEIMKSYPHVQQFPGKYLISPRKWKLKEAEFIHKVTKVITVSNEFKEEVLSRIQLDSEKIVVVPNTVRTSFYTMYELDQKVLKAYEDHFSILYIGDTGLRRGLQTAIEAISLLKEKVPSIKLIVVGKNSSDPILKSQVKALGVERYVDFTGWQPMHLFPSYILASSVCISPLHRNVQHDVAYANKLFQYMSFAKPLLVSNATAQKNLIEKKQSGLVHEAQNVTDFADKVFKLYQDKELRGKLGANGKRFIESEFNWEKASKSLLDLYASLSQ